MEFNCKHCDVAKSADDFYVSNKSMCKDCVKLRVHNRRLEKLDEIQAYDRVRGQILSRKKANGNAPPTVCQSSIEERVGET